MISALPIIAMWFSVGPVAADERSQITTSPATQTQPQAVESLDRNAALQALLDDVDARLRRIKTLRSEFEQRKYTALLKQPLISSGEFMLKGDAIRWETRKPRPSTMAISGGEVKVYYPEARAVEIYEARGDLRELWGSPLPHIAALRERFIIRELDPAELGVQATANEQLLALELSPKTDELKEHITSVRALIDVAAPCIRRMIITDADGDRTELDFKNIQLNGEIDDSELDLKIPQGTKVSRPIGAHAESRPAATAPQRESGK